MRVIYTFPRKLEHRQKGEPWTRWHVTNKFKEMIRKAGLPERYSLHSLRRTYVTYLHEKGVPTNIIQRLIGHSSPTITFMEYDSSDALSFRQFTEQMDIGRADENQGKE